MTHKRSEILKLFEAEESVSDNSLFSFDAMVKKLNDGKYKMVVEYDKIIKFNKDKNGIITKEIMAKNRSTGSITGGNWYAKHSIS